MSNQMVEEFLLGFGNAGTRARHGRALAHLFEFIKMGSRPREEEVDFSSLLPRLAANGDLLYYEVVDKEFVRAFVAWRVEAGDSAIVLGEKIRTVRRYFEFLARRGILKDNPAACVRTPHVECLPRDANWLDVHEFDALLSAAARGEFPERDEAVIMVAGVVTLRPQEIAGLFVGDVQAEPRRILVHNNAKTREVYLGVPDVVLAAIKAYLSCPARKLQPMTHLFLDNRGRPYTSQTLTQHLKGLASRAGISRNVNSYILRHSAATLLILGGGTVLDAQGLLRHKDLRATRTYTHGVDLSQLNQVQRGIPTQIIRNWLRQTFR